MGRETYFFAFSACQADMLDDTDDSPCLGDQEKRMDSDNLMRKTVKQYVTILDRTRSIYASDKTKRNSQLPYPQYQG